MKTNRKERPQARNKINDQYYQSRHWKIIRVKALNRDRYQCQEHKDAGMIEPANVVDHVVPIKDGGSYELFNLRSLCSSCHAKKSAREKRF